MRQLNIFERVMKRCQENHMIWYLYRFLWFTTMAVSIMWLWLGYKITSAKKDKTCAMFFADEILFFLTFTLNGIYYIFASLLFMISLCTMDPSIWISTILVEASFYRFRQSIIIYVEKESNKLVAEENPKEDSVMNSTRIVL